MQFECSHFWYVSATPFPARSGYVLSQHVRQKLVLRGDGVLIILCPAGW